MSRAARTTAQALAVFVACALGLHAMLATLGATVPDVDAFYHFEVSALLREHGPWVDISWLPFTVLGGRGPDHQWFFHALVAPLTALGHDQRALNIATAVVAAAMPAAILPFLRRAEVPFAALFAVTVMFASAALPFRFLCLRAQDLALVLMVASMFAMAWRKPAWVGAIAFFFTESYHGAVILALILAATLAVQWLYERRITFPLVTAIAVGVFAGLVLSPWFPQNVRYLIFHTVFKTGSHDAFLVGGEWLASPWTRLVTENLVANVAWLSGMLAIGATRARGSWPKVGQDTLVACALAAVFLAMSKTTWRFLEYYAPFAIVASGLLWRDAWRASAGARWARIAPAAILVAGLAWGIPRGLETLQASYRRPFDAFSQIMGYIDAHDARPMVFNTLWSDFEQMMFWSPRARYVAGLDGNYLMYGPDRARAQLWYLFSSGQLNDRHDVARAIAGAYGARWIVVPNRQAPLKDSLLQDPDAHLVLTEPRAGWLFEIKPGT